MPGRLRNTLLAPVLAVALAGCGSDDGTIPPSDSDNLIAQLDSVEQAVAAGDCVTAGERSEDFVDLVDDLPAEVGAETKAALREAGANLALLTSDEEQCQPTGATGETGVEPVEPTTEPETEPTTTETATEEEPEEEEPEEEEPEEEEDEEGPGGGGPDGGPDGGGQGPPSGGVGGGGNG